jgi:hypothetical protein
MKQFQFGLRLFLLVVTLLATCFAWRGAIRSKELHERQMVVMRCEAILAAEERWCARVKEDMKRAPDDPQAVPMAIGLAQLKYSEARMAAVRKEMK